MSPLDRLLKTIELVHREGRHLLSSRERLFSRPITPEWIAALGDHPADGEMLEAFMSRFGRMQDTMADKLLPRWLVAQAESPGSLIETLHRAEQLGVIDSAASWLEARKLRNRLIHEYMTDPAEFAADLRLGEKYARMLLVTYENMWWDITRRLGVAPASLPGSLIPPETNESLTES